MTDLETKLKALKLRSESFCYQEYHSATLAYLKALEGKNNEFTSYGTRTWDRIKSKLFANPRSYQFPASINRKSYNSLKTYYTVLNAYSLKKYKKKLWPYHLHFQAKSPKTAKKLSFNSVEDVIWAQSKAKNAILMCLICFFGLKIRTIRHLSYKEALKVCEKLSHARHEHLYHKVKKRMQDFLMIAQAQAGATVDHLIFRSHNGELLSERSLYAILERSFEKDHSPELLFQRQIHYLLHKKSISFEDLYHTLGISLSRIENAIQK